MPRIIHILGIASFTIIIGCNSANDAKNSNDTQNVKGRNDTSEVNGMPRASNMGSPRNVKEDSTVPAVVTLIRNTLVQDMFKRDLGSMTTSDRKFSFDEMDLNGDGEKEIFVAFTGPYFCGTGGCTVALLNSKGKQITLFSIVDYPLYILPDKTKGWSDIVITSKGVKYLLKWNGKNYPSNPSMQPRYSIQTDEKSLKILDNTESSYSWYSF